MPNILEKRNRDASNLKPNGVLEVGSPEPTEHGPQMPFLINHGTKLPFSTNYGQPMPWADNGKPISSTNNGQLLPSADHGEFFSFPDDGELLTFPDDGGLLPVPDDGELLHFPELIDDMCKASGEICDSDSPCCSLIYCRYIRDVPMLFELECHKGQCIYIHKGEGCVISGTAK